MRRETEDLTSEQDVKLRAAKIVRRKIAKRGSRMRRMAKTIPDVLTVIGRASTVPAVLKHLNLVAGELEANLEASRPRRCSRTAARRTPSWRAPTRRRRPR